MIQLGIYTAGEIPEPLEYQFLDSAGDPIDLSAYEATFVMSEADGGARVELEAEVTAPAEGKVTHVWAADEIAAGTWRADFWVDNGTNRFASDRFTISTLEAL